MIDQFQTALRHRRPSAPSPQFMPDAKPVCIVALAALDELPANRERFAEVWRSLLQSPWRDEPFFPHADLAAVVAPDDSTLEHLAIDPYDQWEHARRWQPASVAG